MSLFKILSPRYKPLTRNTRTIMVINSKGGSGKTTIATNLASYFADRGRAVMLADFDPQASSLNWLAVRPDDKPKIHGLAAFKEPMWIPTEIDTVIMDVPAGVRAGRLRYLVRHAQTILIPVLPSAFDIRAAANFIDEIKQLDKIVHLQAKVAFIANRVRENTRAYDALDEFLKGWKLPIIAHLREHQNYTAAADKGLGIFEFGSHATDREQWEPLIKWLRGKGSKPLAV